MLFQAVRYYPKRKRTTIAGETKMPNAGATRARAGSFVEAWGMSFSFGASPASYRLEPLMHVPIHT